MGLIKAAKGAIGGTLADSWKEAIHCDVMNNTIIMRDGVLMNNSGKRSSNTKGTNNVISNGSVILVEENTCMLTIDNGKITNVVSEPGEYVFDNSTEPSIFAGQITVTINTAISRFMHGGGASSEQRVVYINLQPLPGIPFGTGTPMPYPDPRYNTTIDLRFYGTFEIQITDALMAVKFYKEVGNKGARGSDMAVTDIFKTQQYKNEFMQAMMQSLSMLSGKGISYNQISAHLFDLTDGVSRSTENNWKTRGFTVTNIAMGPVTISDESKELLKDRLKADTMLGGDVQRAMMTGSVARGIENAAGNSGGSMMGFMGMNAAMNAGGNILSQMPNEPQNSQNQNQWQCSCGEINSGKFCQNCGRARNGAAKYKCDKCGYIPADETKPPKFCPECGDIFNENDKAN